MADLAQHDPGMSLEDFLAWEAEQDEKWELVDGCPVRRRTRLMAGGTAFHALIAGNVLSEFRSRLPRGGPCAPFGSDLKVLSPTGSVRYPDVTIDCGPRGPKTLIAADPRVIVEVLSPSNNVFKHNQLMRDYWVMPGLAHIATISQEAAYAQVWLRDQSWWAMVEVEGLDAALAFPAIEIEIPMAEVYAGVSFEPAAGDA